MVAAAGTDDFESLSRDDKEAMVAAFKARRYGKPRSQEGRQGQGSQGGAKRCRHHYRWGIQSIACKGGAFPDRNKVKEKTPRTAAVTDTEEAEEALETAALYELLDL